MLDAFTSAAEAYSQHQRLDFSLAVIVCMVVVIVASSAGMWKK